MADSCYDRALSTDDVVISWLWLRSPDLVQPPQHVHSLTSLLSNHRLTLTTKLLLLHDRIHLVNSLHFRSYWSGTVVLSVYSKIVCWCTLHKPTADGQAETT